MTFLRNDLLHNNQLLSYYYPLRAPSPRPAILGQEAVGLVFRLSGGPAASRLERPSSRSLRQNEGLVLLFSIVVDFKPKMFRVENKKHRILASYLLLN